MKSFSGLGREVQLEDDAIIISILTILEKIPRANSGDSIDIF